MIRWIMHRLRIKKDTGIEEERKIPEHEHEWEEVDRWNDTLCTLCENPLIKGIREKCKICGETRTRYEKVESYEELYGGVHHHNTAYAHPYYIKFCKDCYRKLQDKIKEIETEIAKEIEVYDFKESFNVRDISFYNMKDLIRWVKKHGEFASKCYWETKESLTTVEAGIVIYVKTKNEFEPYYRCFLPWTVLIEEIKRKNIALLPLDL